MENGKKIIVFILLFLIIGSVSTFAFLIYQQKNQQQFLPTLDTSQEKLNNNSEIIQEKDTSAQTPPIENQTPTNQEQTINEENINVKMIDGALVELKAEENKLILKKIDDGVETIINLNPSTIYSRIFLVLDPTVKKGEVKKEETIQLSDLKNGDELSIKIVPDSENLTAELVRVVLLEN